MPHEPRAPSHQPHSTGRPPPLNPPRLPPPAGPAGPPHPAASPPHEAMVHTLGGVALGLVIYDSASQRAGLTSPEPSVFPRHIHFLLSSALTLVSTGKSVKMICFFTSRFHLWVFFPERNENRALNKYLHIYAHSCVIHDTQKVETTQASLDRYPRTRST